MSKLNVSEPWAAWTAGIIDGEGSCSIVRFYKKCNSSRITYNVRIEVRNTDKAMIEKLLQLWGGIMHRAEMTSAGNQVYRWTVPPRKVVEFIDYIYPYSIAKKKQLILCRELRRRVDEKVGIVQVSIDNHPSPCLTNEEREYRRRLREKNHSFHRRGAFPFVP